MTVGHALFGSLLICKDPQLSKSNLRLFIGTLRHGISAWGIAIHGGIVAVSGNDYIISLFNMENNNRTQLVGHEHNIPSIDFSLCGDYLFSCSIGTIIRLIVRWKF